MGIFNKNKSYKVIIPNPDFTVFEFIQNEFVGIAEVNTALRKFEPKLVFSWHLSIMIRIEDVDNKGLPSKNEIKKIKDFQSKLDNIFIGNLKSKPNSIFFAKISWNNSIELIWRVYNPKLINNELKKIINNKFYPRPFDYRIDPDNDWDLTKWLLDDEVHFN